VRPSRQTAGKVFARHRTRLRHQGGIFNEVTQGHESRNDVAGGDHGNFGRQSSWNKKNGPEQNRKKRTFSGFLQDPVFFGAQLRSNTNIFSISSKLFLNLKNQYFLPRNKNQIISLLRKFSDLANRFFDFLPITRQRGPRLVPMGSALMDAVIHQLLSGKTTKELRWKSQIRSTQLAKKIGKPLDVLPKSFPVKNTHWPLLWIKK